MSGAIDVAEITRADDLAALAEEWEALCDRSAACTPFQRPAWLLAWCKHFPPPALLAIAMRREGRLVGLAPLFVWTRERERVVSLVGAGISDRLDAIFERGFEAEGARLLFAHLGAARERWDACELDALDFESALATADAPGDWSSSQTEDPPRPRLVTRSPGGGDLATSVPSRQLARFRKARRRAEREGALDLRTSQTHEWEPLLAALFRLHTARWASRGGDGAVGDDTLLRFHRDAAAAFDRRSALRLFALFLGDACIAALYAFADERTLYCYLQGFDPRFERFSPGMLIVGLVIEEAARSGLSAIDFLRGAEPYKYAWGAIDVPMRRRRLVRSGAAIAPQAPRGEPAR
jgi:CelD/BcsL family acetyltransferase involved in cellulose biosynthesis